MSTLLKSENLKHK